MKLLNNSVRKEMKLNKRQEMFNWLEQSNMLVLERYLNIRSLRLTLRLNSTEVRTEPKPSWTDLLYTLNFKSLVSLMIIQEFFLQWVTWKDRHSTGLFPTLIPTTSWYLTIKNSLITLNYLLWCKLFETSIERERVNRALKG
jgi:hypothetical protein